MAVRLHLLQAIVAPQWNWRPESEHGKSMQFADWSLIQLEYIPCYRPEFSDGRLSVGDPPEREDPLAAARLLDGAPQVARLGLRHRELPPLPRLHLQSVIETTFR